MSHKVNRGISTTSVLRPYVAVTPMLSTFNPRDIAKRIKGDFATAEAALAAWDCT
jgi:hypothetical protein